MQLSKLNFQSAVLTANSIFCAVALYLVVNTFFQIGKKNVLFIIEKSFLVVILSCIIFFHIKYITKKPSIFILIGSIIIFLISFAHVFLDIFNVGFINYFMIAIDMLRLGQIGPHASIVFGVWNLFVFYVVRHVRLSGVRVTGA